KDEAAHKGIRLTMLAFLMKASVTALRKYPDFNASLASDGANLILKKYYHIGIAVDTPEGLVVPVVRNVDQKGILDLARELGEVSERARASKLTPGDLQGGTFTISSLGGIGGLGFTPIINAPEVAILGVARARKMPVYREANLVPRLMLPLSLSYDHRVIDGAAAARYTAYLTRVLGDARLLLL
ncbi:MAG: 2-oxo acid dehydrogenase subunit E2, partial [Gammaproteobacteria bacterium]|nr:2-oxo acid dehydrogenase subunit E2 [Gammaproteobacteria bacterium]